MSSQSKDRQAINRGAVVRDVTLALVMPAIFAVVWYGIDPGAAFAVALLIATCSFAVGGLLGFLFGIPQYMGSSAPTDDKPFSYQPNTNLTQVSDWLTKIIIGVGLVQFSQLVDALGDLGDELGPDLGGGTSGDTFAIALVVGFFVIGVLVGYLYTRLRLQEAFAESDRGAFGEREVAEIQRAERVRPLPGVDEDGVEVKKRPRSAGYEEISKRMQSKLRIVRNLLTMQGVEEDEYQDIVTRLKRDGLITEDEKEFILELVKGDLDLSGWPTEARSEFLNSAWIFATRFSALIWDREVRRRLRAAGWFIADFEQLKGHRPDFLGARDGRWAVMAARVSGIKKNSTDLSVVGRRLAKFKDAGEEVEGRCVVIPDVRDATVINPKKPSKAVAEKVKVLKLGTLLSDPEAAFGDVNEDLACP